MTYYYYRSTWTPPSGQPVDAAAWFKKRRELKAFRKLQVEVERKKRRQRKEEEEILLYLDLL